METRTTTFFVVLCTLLSCFSCGKVGLSKERGAFLKQYLDPAYSPEARNWIESIAVDTMAEEILDPERRRLQFGCPPLCAPEPTPQPVLPPTPPPSNLDMNPQNPYILVNVSNRISWETSKDYCQNQIGSGSVLASVNKDDTRRTEQQQIDAMTALCATTDHDCWIGLTWDNATMQWQWENDQYLKAWDGDIENWAADGDQLPSLGINPICVLLDDLDSYQWIATKCIGEAPEFVVHAALCTNPLYLPYPTMTPTKQPSSPSRTPTSYPSDYPTDVPTLTTVHPSASPSDNPTDIPTRTTTVPSRATINPTQVTADPSKDPTGIPTVHPTNVPTLKPTGDPTAYPTTAPSKPPTNNPTKYPSAGPSQRPSSAPTGYPTIHPTNDPSKHPSSAPTSIRPFTQQTIRPNGRVMIPLDIRPPVHPNNRVFIQLLIHPNSQLTSQAWTQRMFQS
eukprot:699424_1